jgi:uncharacterized protein YegL
MWSVICPVLSQHLIYFCCPVCKCFLLSSDTSAVAGEPWSNLQEAVRAFLTTRVSDDAEDLISIIAFGSEARELCKRLPILDCLRRLDTLLQNKGGGTNFSAALRLARDVLRGSESEGPTICKAVDSTEAGHSPVLLFMSDGQPDSRSIGISEMQVLLGPSTVPDILSSP